MKIILWLFNVAYLIVLLFLAAAYIIPRTSSTLLLVLGAILFSPVIVAMMKK